MASNGTITKLAPTANGWAIALIAKVSTGSEPGTYYEIVRVAPSNKYMALYQTRDLAEARKLANREWSADKAAA